MRFLLSISVLLLTAPIQFSEAQTLRRVPQHYRTVQEAIDASRMGDTVLVDHGVYYENVHITQNIVLASRFIIDGDTTHIRQTVLDGSRPRDTKLGSVVTLTGATDTLCQVLGFTIRNGTGTVLHLARFALFPPRTKAGGGILVLNAGGRIAHNTISQNRLSVSGDGGISLGGGILTIDTTFAVKDPPSIIIEHNVITNNEVAGPYTRSGGVEISQPGSVRRNVITHNRSLSQIRSGGGGLSVQSSVAYTVNVDGNYIAHNTSGNGGGIFIVNDFGTEGIAILTNNIISNNEAYELGGGVALNEGGPTAILVNNTIVRNISPLRGGGVSAPHGSVLTLVNNIIWGNEREQVTSAEHARALNNLVDSMDLGQRTIREDPLFVPGDSLFRLAPGSPCIGNGATNVHMAGIPFTLPAFDYAGVRRTFSAERGLDIGAMESGTAMGPAGRRLRDIWEDEARRTTTLHVAIRQTAPRLISADGLRIERGGILATEITIDGTEIRAFPGPATDLSFTFPPDDNLLEIDLIARGRDMSQRLFASVWLHPVEQRSNRLTPSQDYLFCRYRDLGPGTYELIIRPQDEQEFIDIANQSSIRIEVLPYWYNRWWAYLLYTMLVAGGFLAIYRTRMKHVALEQKLLAEHLQAEKLEELDKVKSRFFANVTHELRTPLTLILGPVESLLAGAHGRAFSEQLGYIQRNALKLLRSVNLLLDLSRLESGTVKLRVIEQDATQLLRRMTGYFVSTAAQRQIDLRFNARDDAIIGHCDTEKLDHILQNLLSNAMKFCRKGDTIDVTVWKERHGLCFSVRDSGPGIPAEHLPSVFDRFYRVDETHKTEGTGIGLSLTKEFVEIHHGSIEVQSTVGEGTTFTVRIPLTGYSLDEVADAMHNTSEHVPQTSADGPERDTTPETGTGEGRPVILIAEDNDDARQFISSQLSDQYEVIKTVDGLEAINTTQHQIPDLIISDVMMPNKDGYEVCKAIKTDERTCHIPVVLLTALAEQEQKLSGLEYGADDYLAKPFDVEELKVRVRNLLENRRKVRESFMRTTDLRPGSVHVASLDDTFLQKAIAVVEKHMGTADFDVEQFARAMFLSRRQLTRKLTAVTNLSATDFIRHLRLQRAKDLLEQHTGSIAEIADSVGFANHSYFARTFHEKFGVLPSQIGHPQE